MKKRILKVACFWFILLLILLILSSIFIPKNNTVEAGMDEVQANGILGEKENSIEVLILGNSESISAIIPNQIKETTGCNVYVSGFPGQVLIDTVYMLNRVCEKQRPRKVVLEADNIFTPAPLKTPIVKIANKVMPIIRYHSRWKSLNWNDFGGKINYTYTDENKGYYGSDVVEPADSSKYMIPTDKRAEIPKANEICVKIIKEYCDKVGAQLVFISIPNTKNWNYEKHNTIEDYAKNENIEFLDLNIHTQEIGIDWNTDSRDGGDHLNNSGARKVTSYIQDFLVK